MPEDIVHTIKESCYLLKICRTTLWDQIKRKKIRVLHIGRRVLIPHDELLRFINGRRDGRA